MASNPIPQQNFQIPQQTTSYSYSPYRPPAPSAVKADDEEEEDGGHLLLIFLICFGVFILVVFIYLLVAYFIGLPPFSGENNSSSATRLCSGTEVISAEEAYEKYTDKTILENPLVLFSQASNTTHSLQLKKIPKTGSSCLAEGFAPIPFPKYCQAFSNYELVNEYIEEPNQTSTTSRKYVDEDGNILTFRQNCVPVVEDVYFYSPATKW